jgi:diguanylate cyclase
MVMSLLIWAASFYVHPRSLKSAHYQPLAEHVWSMQKYFLCFGMLITLLENEIKENEWFALHDPLTGLANRRVMERHALSVIECGRGQVLLFDLDGFKEVNDSLGHAAGDLVLREVPRRIQPLLAPDDLLARVGGDEFTIVSKNTNHSLVTDIHRVMQEPILVEDVSVRVGASMGVSRFPEDCEGFTGMDAVRRLLEAADRSMYAHKRDTHRRRHTDPKPIDKPN